MDRKRGERGRGINNSILLLIKGEEWGEKG
jgi:hypothetical protein